MEVSTIDVCYNGISFKERLREMSFHKISIYAKRRVVAFIRNPASPMPSFTQGTISDKRAEELYTYITSERGLNVMKPN